MNVEKAIESLLKNQARADARFNAKFDRADQDFRKWETRQHPSEWRLLTAREDERSRNVDDPK